MARREWGMLMWVKRLLGAAMLGAVLCCTGGCAGTAGRGPDAVEYDVYGALIEEMFVVEGTERVVLRDRTEVHTVEDLEDTLQYVQDELGASLTEEMLDDFRGQNAASYSLTDEMELTVELVLLSDGRFEEIFGGIDHSAWPTFHVLYPKSQGLLTVSRVGFNEARDVAVVYVGNQVDGKAGRGWFAVLKREGGDWSVVERVIVWMS